MDPIIVHQIGALYIVIGVFIFYAIFHYLYRRSVNPPEFSIAIIVAMVFGVFWPIILPWAIIQAMRDTSCPK